MKIVISLLFNIFSVLRMYKGIVIYVGIYVYEFVRVCMLYVSIFSKKRKYNI